MTAPSAVSASPAPVAGPSEAAIVIENLAQPGAFEIRAGRAPVSLARHAAIERQAGDKWVVVVSEGEHMTLAEECPRGTPPRCVDLAGAARLRPVPWTGYSCSGQCWHSCRRNVLLPPGTFRLVVRSCDGNDRYEGPPFQMPAGAGGGP